MSASCRHLYLFSFGTGLAFEPDLVADTYTAVFENDGTLTETYAYDVASPGTYRMLFRTWDDTLAFEEQQTPYVEFIDVKAPADMVAMPSTAGGAMPLLPARMGGRPSVP